MSEHAKRPGAPRWLLLRGLVALLLSLATAAASAMLLGLGGVAFVPIILLAGVVQSFKRSPAAWVCYGYLFSVGLFVGGLGMWSGDDDLSPAMYLLWLGAGLLGLAMIGYGYFRIWLGAGNVCGPQSSKPEPPPDL